MLCASAPLRELIRHSCKNVTLPPPATNVFLTSFDQFPNFQSNTSTAFGSPQTLPGNPTMPNTKPKTSTPQFVLQPFHHNVPDDQLTNDLIQVAHKINADTFSQAIYRQHGQFNPLTLSQRFGS